MSMVNFNLQKEQSSIIKVIGVGGGGSNALGSGGGFRAFATFAFVAF